MIAIAIRGSISSVLGANRRWPEELQKVIGSASVIDCWIRYRGTRGVLLQTLRKFRPRNRRDPQNRRAAPRSTKLSENPQQADRSPAQRLEPSPSTPVFE